MSNCSVCGKELHWNKWTLDYDNGLWCDVCGKLYCNDCSKEIYHVNINPYHTTFNYCPSHTDKEITNILKKRLGYLDYKNYEHPETNEFAKTVVRYDLILRALREMERKVE